MAERLDDTNLVHLVRKGFNTQKFDAEYDELDPSTRKDTIADFESKTKFLRRGNLILTRKEQQKKSSEQENRLKPNEREHPERYIKRVFKRDGLYLDFSRDEVETSIVSVQKYLEVVRPHVERHGEGSIANLCPSKLIFVVLTGGVEVRPWFTNDREVTVVNTIEELQGLRSILHQDRSARVYRHNPRSLTRGKALNLKSLFTELDEWEEIRHPRPH